MPRAQSQSYQNKTKGQPYKAQSRAPKTHGLLGSTGLPRAMQLVCRLRLAPPNCCCLWQLFHGTGISKMLGAPAASGLDFHQQLLDCFSQYQPSTSLHDPFSPGLQLPLRLKLREWPLLASLQEFCHDTQCQASAAPRDPFTP